MLTMSVNTSPKSLKVETIYITFLAWAIMQ